MECDLDFNFDPDFDYDNLGIRSEWELSCPSYSAGIMALDKLGNAIITINIL